MAFQPGQQAYCQAVGTSNTSNLVIFDRDPTIYDVNYPIGRFWINTTLQNLYYLNSLSNASGQLLALWNLISVDSVLASLSGSNTPSVPVFASSVANPLLDNIQLTNLDGSMTITSDPGNNRILFTSTSAGDVQTLTGNSGGAISPSGGNINTLGTGSITISGSGSTLTTQLTGLTNHNVLVGAGTATITNVAPSTSGFVLTSNGPAADPSFQAAASAFTYVGIAGTTQLAAVSTGYINQNALLTTITLPDIAPLGSVIAVQGLGAGGWILQTGIGQNIQNGTVSTSVNGTLASVNQYDTCYLVCIVADTTWSTAYNTSFGLIAT